MAKQYVEKPMLSDPYRVDNRATVNVPTIPESSDILDGPSVIAVSGVRCNDDTYYSND